MNHPGYIESLFSRIRQSVTLKLLNILLLSLLLLIPADMIRSIIQERAQRSEEAMNEVYSLWAGQQRIGGPMLTIPVQVETMGTNGPLLETSYWHILPEKLEIEATVLPQELHRGIYQAVVYQTAVKLSGEFVPQAFRQELEAKEILWDQAFFSIGVTDLRGIKDPIEIRWNGVQTAPNPGTRMEQYFSSGISMPVTGLQPELPEPIPFSINLQLKGSESLKFTPVGSKTVVYVKSNWASPSFTGNFLPDERQIDSEGFQAKWSILELNRNFPQAWIGNAYSQDISNSAFGVNLLVPMDNYQKAERSVKYAAMTIALTFLTFFLVEIMGKRKIHPFQYLLVGLALCLFYALLVSITEHLSFNLAYGISAGVVILLVTLYSRSVFKQRSRSAVLMIILGALYSFLFVTLQLTDFALLMGSIGLVVILALTMFYTRNINWYRVQLNEEETERE